MPTDESVNLLKRTFNLNKKYIISTVMPILGVTSVCGGGRGGGARRKWQLQCHEIWGSFPDLPLEFIIPWLFCSSETRLAKKLSADLQQISGLTKLSTPTPTEEKS